MIWGIASSFVWFGTFIKRHGREIEIWNNTLNRKGVVESVIKRPVVVLYH